MSGLLLDSLANRPVDSQWVYWTVGTTRDSAITSQAGAFTFTIPTGPVHILYPDQGYETRDETLDLRRDTSIVFRLRRSPAFLRGFSVSPEGLLQATIVDLQGVSTIVLDNATWVVYNYGTVDQSSAIQAPNWTWAVVDSVTLSVSVATSSTTVTNAYWHVTDDRYSTGFLCQAGQPSCTPDFP